MTESKKYFINLGNKYLSSLNLKRMYEISGQEPPDGLVNKITILEQKIQHIAKTL
jgi:hypothetical protein